MLKYIFLVAFVLLFACPSSADNQLCNQCQVIASTVKFLVDSNATVAEIESRALDLCVLFPPSFADQCRKSVEQFLPRIIQLVKTYDNPQVVCTAIGLCASKTVNVKVNADECTICTYLVGIAENWIASNATETRILGIFETACAILPGNSKYTCRAIIDQYGRELIQLLINEENPTQVCTLLKACPAPKASVVQTKAKADPIPCYLCKYVVQVLEAFITSNSTEAEILAFAENICKVLPTQYRPICLSLVDVYIPQVIQELINKEDPATVCTAISLCSSGLALERLTEAFSSRKKLQADPQNCQLCQFLVITLEGYVTSNTTVQQLLQYANLFCNTLGPLSSSCKAFVAKELPLVVQYIISKASPLVVCTKLRVCSALSDKKAVLLSN